MDRSPASGGAAGRPNRSARAAGAAFPFAALAGELYAAGAGQGLGDRDFAAVLEVLERLSDARV